MESLDNGDLLNQEKKEKKLGKKEGKKRIQLERTRTAFERLQLAWIRTSLTMLTIGVAAYEYFYNLMEKGQAPLLKLFSGRELGFIFIVSAFIMLLLATIKHIKNMAFLKKNYKEMRYSVASLLSYLLLALSFFLGFMVLLKFEFHMNI